MAKSRSEIKFSGKIGDHVHVHSSKYGNHVRMPAKGRISRKVAEVLEGQNKRTKFLNGLASELNEIMLLYYGRAGRVDFYHRVQKYFRREKLDNRYFLLLQLKEMDLHPRYPFHKLGKCSTEVRKSGKELIVELQGRQHPDLESLHADSYCYDILLITWNKSGRYANHANCANHARQYGEWIGTGGKYPRFEFVFPITAKTIHWLLCVRKQLGKNEKPIASFKAQRVQITDAGTFDSDDQKIIDERKTEVVEKKSDRPQEQIIRIKAKNWTD